MDGWMDGWPHGALISHARKGASLPPDPGADPGPWLPTARSPCSRTRWTSSTTPARWWPPSSTSTVPPSDPTTFRGASAAGPPRRQRRRLLHRPPPRQQGTRRWWSGTGGRRRPFWGSSSSGEGGRWARGTTCSSSHIEGRGVDSRGKEGRMCTWEGGKRAGEKGSIHGDGME